MNCQQRECIARGSTWAGRGLSRETVGIHNSVRATTTIREMGYRHRHAKSQSMRLLVKPCCCWLGGHLAVLCLLACLPAVGARSLSAHEPQSQNHLPVSRASSRGAGIAVPGSSTLVQSNDHLTGSRHEGAVEPYAAHHSAEPRCKLFQKKRRQLHHTIRKVRYHFFSWPSYD